MSKCICPQCACVVSWPDLPALLPLPDASDNWRVDCAYLSPLVNGVAVLVKRGLTTDGASVPRLAWRVIGHPFAKDLLPHALIHDALYASELLPRGEADDWFLASMASARERYALGVGWARRNAVWSAVRAAGGLVWSRHTPASVAAARALVRVLTPDEYGAVRMTRHLPEHW